MQKIKIMLNKEKIFNGNLKKPGTIILNGEIPDGIEPAKVVTSIKLGETTFEIIKPEKSEGKGKDK